MKYYLKQGVFPFVYVIFMSIIAFGILMIPGLVWLKALLAVLNVSFYAFIVAAASYKEGQEAMKTLYANDLERRETEHRNDGMDFTSISKIGKPTELPRTRIIITVNVRSTTRTTLVSNLSLL